MKYDTDISIHTFQNNLRTFIFQLYSCFNSIDPSDVHVEVHASGESNAVESFADDHHHQSHEQLHAAAVNDGQSIGTCKNYLLILQFTRVNTFLFNGLKYSTHNHHFTHCLGPLWDHERLGIAQYFQS